MPGCVLGTWKLPHLLRGALWSEGGSVLFLWPRAGGGPGFFDDPILPAMGGPPPGSRGPSGAGVVPPGLGAGGLGRSGPSRQRAAFSAQGPEVGWGRPAADYASCSPGEPYEFLIRRWGVGEAKAGMGPSSVLAGPAGARTPLCLSLAGAVARHGWRRLSFVRARTRGGCLNRQRDLSSTRRVVDTGGAEF